MVGKAMMNIDPSRIERSAPREVTDSARHLYGTVMNMQRIFIRK